MRMCGVPNPETRAPMSRRSEPRKTISGSDAALMIDVVPRASVAAITVIVLGGPTIGTLGSTAMIYALPVAAFACVKLLGLSGVEAGVLVLWAALPTASSAYILAVRMGGDGPSVATQITVGTLLSMATLPLWVAALP